MPLQRILLPVLALAAFATSELFLFRPSQAAEPIEAAASADLIAQSTSSENASGRSLSVTGTSQVNAPADQAIIVLSYYPNSYASDSSDLGASPLQIQPSDLKIAVDALTATGLAAENVKAYPDFTSPGSMRIRLLLSQPTQAKVEQIIDAANTAVTKGNRFMTSGATVGYTVQNCQVIENQARQAAMMDAQKRAAALAEVANTQIGEVLSLSESVSWGSGYTSACPASNDPTAYSDSYSLPMYDPAIPPIVKVIYSLSVTYGMQ